MYEEIDGRLTELKILMDKAEVLEQQFTEQQKNMNRVQDRLQELKKSLDEQLLDIEQMETDNLVSFFRKITGGYRRKLAAKIQESEYSRRLLEDAKAEFEKISSEYYAVKRLYEKSKGARREFEELLNKKIQLMKEQEVNLSDYVTVTLGQITYLKNRIALFDEAVLEGSRVIGHLDVALEHLSAGAGLGKLDMLTDNMYIKKQKMDEVSDAEHSLQGAQIAMSRFNTRLVGIEQQTLTVTGIGKGTKTDDLFFDDIFTEVNMLSNISKTKEQMITNIEHVKQLMEKIQEHKAELVGALAEKESQLHEYILKS